jgi:PST family polysaccharide transporter
MFTAIYFVKGLIPDTIPTVFRLTILCATGGFIYTALMIGVFRNETRNFLIESAGIMPNKIRPAIAGLQKITRLH